MKIRLGDADRERLGCPEWMELDLSALSVGEAEVLDESGGDWTVIAAKGAKAAKTRVWLALYRAGVVVPYRDLTFDILSIEAQDDEPGKAKDSADVDSNTRRTSASSTRPSRRKRS